MRTHEQILEAYRTDHKGGWDHRFTDSAKVRFLQFFPKTEWSRFDYTDETLRDDRTPFETEEGKQLALIEENVVQQMAKDLAWGFAKVGGPYGSSPMIPCMLLGMWLWILDDTFALDIMSQSDRCSEKLMIETAKRYDLPCGMT